MTINDKIKDEDRQNDIIREATKKYYQYNQSRLIRSKQVNRTS